MSYSGPVLGELPSTAPLPVSTADLPFLISDIETMIKVPFSDVNTTIYLKIGNINVSLLYTNEVYVGFGIINLTEQGIKKTSFCNKSESEVSSNTIKRTNNEINIPCETFTVDGDDKIIFENELNWVKT